MCHHSVIIVPSNFLYLSIKKNVIHMKPMRVIAIKTYKHDKYKRSTQKLREGGIKKSYLSRLAFQVWFVQTGLVKSTELKK